ncbi:MAG: hypothetical protein Q9198_008012 [Flavoplaca austrocitrina]
MARTQDHDQLANEPPPNIYIIGVQSTGNTTLVLALRDYFAQNLPSEKLPSQPYQLKEVARGVLLRHQFTVSDISSSKERSLELQRLIIEARAAAEGALQHIWYIADRSALDAVAYARQYVGEAEARGLRHGVAWQQVEEKIRAGVVILCEPGGEWLMHDGVRLMPRGRNEWFTLKFHFQIPLVECGIPYATPPCSVSTLRERVDSVVQAWKQKQKLDAQGC